MAVFTERNYDWCYRRRYVPIEDCTVRGSIVYRELGPCLLPAVIYGKATAKLILAVSCVTFV